ncbi:MAG TPA: hypothetical protein VFX81_08960, partial [Burkholderiaceae bacterium]|nr:hypothetical protein [Burkholderiaceae bacterium]
MDAAVPAGTAPELIRLDCSALLRELRPLLVSATPEATGRFRGTLKELLTVPKASPEVVDCFLLVAQYFYLANEPATGLEAAKAASTQARQLMDSPVLLRRALSTEGIMRKETGDLPGATLAFAEALEIARRLGAPENEGVVWNNLGVALMSSAQYMDALKCFERAASLARGSKPDVEQNALTNIASCAVHLKDVKTGIKAVRRAIELNLAPGNASERFSRVSAESNYARLLLEIGELGHAKEHSDAARRFASEAPTARAEFVA